MTNKQQRVKRAKKGNHKNNYRLPEINIRIYTFQAVQAGLLSPSRWSLFFETAYDLHPLVRGDFFVLHNPQDNSSIFVPSISWSVITNLDLYLIGFLTEGPNLSEFGNYGKAFYLRTKYSF